MKWTNELGLWSFDLAKANINLPGAQSKVLIKTLRTGFCVQKQAAKWTSIKQTISNYTL